MSSPEQIQRDIERTRANLSSDVDRLTEKVSPGRVVGRRVDRVKGGATSLKDRVMGAAPSTDHVKSSFGDATSSVGDAASSAPAALRRQTQGNPLAAGLVAFGVGVIAASLLPASAREQEMAGKAQERAADLVEPAKAKAKELAEDLREPAQHSIDEVRSTVTDAAAQTADQARSAADDVRAPLQSQ
ncbi:MAG TPA: DUF3618 domain-containing protein [Jatrophihabitans sp.]|jgi:uncharacterized protein YjbJ (UPF0337 family)|uniref:DUF3618 domain-containing protein n=1 Tax=Jatrophihabitans sp. TaxID=1932789 RepID=UPI002E02976B|nr:DUF3618 domain-containing protein [Jatrophihabitans sp.]